VQGVIKPKSSKKFGTFLICMLIFTGAGTTLSNKWQNNTPVAWRYAPLCPNANAASCPPCPNGNSGCK